MPFIKNNITLKRRMNMVNSGNYIALGGIGNHALDVKIVEVINKFGNCDIKFLHLDMDQFADGEQDFRIPEYQKIKGKHVLLFQSMHKNVRGLGSQFLTLAWAAKYQYGAKSIIAIVPFLLYRRQDHVENMREINRNLMFIQSMKNNGVDKLILCDIHSETTLTNCAKIGIEAWNVDPTPAYVAYLKVLVDMAYKHNRKFFIYSPDAGSIGRAVPLAKKLGVTVAINFKERAHTGKVKKGKDPTEAELKKLKEKYEIEIIVANEKLKGADVAMREDEITTGNTARTAGLYLKNELGVNELTFIATHPVCVSGWRRRFIDNTPFNHIYFGNTIPKDYRKSTGGKATRVDMSQVIGSQLYEIISEPEKTNNKP
ncbi:ribose-phosphate pyrophosphokinase [Candidatus Parcubacteria bacterium]|nr:ribose-phosphate pyrophosphokinase [Candidatus Parcubacteria bacterium]